MGLFSNLMGDQGTQRDRQGKSASAQRPEPGGIAYDARLVDTLKDEHQDLLQAFGNIRQTAAEGRFSHLAGLLDHFRLMLLNHIALENVKFYVYMQNHGGLDTTTQDFINGVRKEMNVIARTVAKFVDTYASELPSHTTIFSFNEELDRIGKVLSQRIQLEESHLYLLYRP